MNKPVRQSKRKIIQTKPTDSALKQLYKDGLKRYLEEHSYMRTVFADPRNAPFLRNAFIEFHRKSIHGEVLHSLSRQYIEEEVEAEGTFDEMLMETQEYRTPSAIEEKINALLKSKKQNWDKIKVHALANRIAEEFNVFRQLILSTLVSVRRQNKELHGSKIPLNFRELKLLNE